MAELPDVKHVVVTTGGELLAIEAPLKSADFSRVASEGRNEGVGEANVPVADGGIERAGGEDVTVPSDGTNATLVAGEFTDRAPLCGVPQLNYVAVETNGQKIGVVRGESDGGNSVVFEVVEESRGSRFEVHEVDGGAQSNSKLIVLRPVKKVEVVVINEARGIEGLESVAGDSDTSTLLLGQVLGIKDLQVVLISRVRGRSLILQSENLVVLDLGRVFAEQRLGQGGLVLRGGLSFGAEKASNVFLLGWCDSN